MAQTTGAMSWEDCKVEIATDAGFSYKQDISGSTNKITTSGGEITTAEVYTHGTLTPIVGYGAAAKRTVEVGVVYTETTNEAFYLADQYYTNKTDVYLRVYPTGSGKAFTTSIGRVMAPPQISGEAGKPDFVVTTFSITCASISWA
jgi:hypothetical protein